MTDQKAMNLFQRINAVRKEVGYVQKDKSVSTGGGSYKAVTHDQVTALTRKAMIDNGIVCYPTLIESATFPPAEEKKQFRYEATYDFYFVNADNPDEKIVLRIQAHAMDNADKAPGKALSYAKKYAVLKLFEIETGEDEESRYQEKPKMPEDVVIKHLEAINAASTMDELKSAFSDAATASEADAEAQKRFIKAKDLKKKSMGKLALDQCTDEKFEERREEWKALVESGKKSANDLIATIETKAQLTDDQKMTIASWEH